MTTPRSPFVADLFGDLEPVARPSLRPRDHVPGLVVTLMAALAAGFLSAHYGAPLTLMALLIGLALNFLNADARLGPGLGFASKTLLRWGIVLVGARVTLAQILHLGAPALLAILVIVALTLLAGILAGRLLGFDTAFGVVAGGAVAICGASAAMALATLLGEKRLDQARLTLILVGIAAMSALAMVAYPLLCHWAGFGDLRAGFVLGAAIHDVAQALGAGYSFSPGAGDAAAIVKLARVALLAPLLLIVGRAMPSESGAKRAGVPWFVIGFFVVAGINSTGVIPKAVATGANDLASAMLVCAVAATGIRSPMASLLESGPKPLAVIAVASAVSLALSFAAAWALIG